MTERPILFSGEMVRAILDGRKTQTRRVMKPQPKPTLADYPGPAGHWWPSQKHKSMLGVEQEMQKWKGLAGSACPYGDTGDTLWVRETWCQGADDGRQVPLRMATLYRADGEHVTLSDGDGFTQTNRDGSEKSPWRPSIHMPRWASRITLRITDVRVERLQDISEHDARAEGMSSEWDDYERYGQSEPYRYGFSAIWNTINGPGAWDDNPWVWVLSFERVKP